jgi:hypothetical protein
MWVILGPVIEKLSDQVKVISRLKKVPVNKTADFLW